MEAIETKRNYINNRLRKEFREVIKRIIKLDNATDSMQHFIDKAESFYTGKTKMDEKYVGTTCIHVPIELIYALGMKPIRLCNGINTYNQHGAQFLPTNTCPLVKSTAGFLLEDLMKRDFKPELVINTLACDQKKKMGATLDIDDVDWYDMPFPSSKEDKASRIYWLMAIEKLIKEMEKRTGKKLRKKNLSDAIIKVARAQKAFRKLNEFRASTNFFKGTHAILIANNFFFEDLEEWTKHVEILVDELERINKVERDISKNESARIMLSGSPSIFPNLNLPIMVEQLGAIVAVDEFCSSNRLLYDMIAVDEWNLYDMIPALADKYLKPSTCPNFVPNVDRIRKIDSLCKSHSIDGVIYQVFQGCQLYDMEAITIRKHLRELKIPVLVVETDYGIDDSGQMQTRLEAFLDSIK